MNTRYKDALERIEQLDRQWVTDPGSRRVLDTRTHLVQGHTVRQVQVYGRYGLIAAEALGRPTGELPNATRDILELLPGDSRHGRLPPTY